MAEEEVKVKGADGNGDDDLDTPGYKKPEEKAMKDMLAQDQEDESLRKYKQSLLGTAASGEEVIFWPDDPRRVIVKKLSLVTEGRDDVDLDLTGDLSVLKKQVFKIKEGAMYRMKVTFCVQREIVTGLKYVQKVSRKGIKVDTTTNMVGSYGPKKEEQSYLTPPEEAPAGMMYRGHYTVKSLFTDDDKHEYLKWEWSFDVSKDW